MDGGLGVAAHPAIAIIKRKCFMPRISHLNSQELSGLSARQFAVDVVVAVEVGEAHLEAVSVDA